MTTNREKKLESLAEFKRLREAAIEADNVHELDQALTNLVDFLDEESTAREATAKLPSVEWTAWWKDHTDSRRQVLKLPVDVGQKTAILLECVKRVHHTNNFFSQLMASLGVHGQSKAIDHFKAVVLRPAMTLFGERMRDVVALATPEGRALIAVPPDLVPLQSQLGVFLSHRTPDKPRVQKYHDALECLGYSPWLDIEAMPAGTIAHRGIQEGIEKSCAVVFFLTENFSDERWIAAEIDHAIGRHTELGSDRFSIITLRFSSNAVVPAALRRFIFKDVDNDLEGLNYLVKGLPIQLGPPRWRR